jgi:hypothetical protein
MWLERMTVMNRNNKNSGGFSVAGLFVVLGITWGLDALMAYLDQRNGETFALPYVILWTKALSSILLAALLLLLFWFVLTRAPRNVWVAALYLLIGLFFGFFQVLYFIPAIGGWTPRFFYVLVQSVNSFTILAGSFIAIIGLFMLVLPRRE